MRYVVRDGMVYPVSIGDDDSDAIEYNEFDGSFTFYLGTGASAQPVHVEGLVSDMETPLGRTWLKAALTAWAMADLAWQRMLEE